MDDDFVPEGYVPLKSAIEQLAEARQTSIKSAQVEIRAKLHSGLIRAAVLRPDTGELSEILSRCWATETALRWFESGTCLLPDENGEVRITTERFDLFYRPENAPIFVVEGDLHRPLGDHRQQDPNSQKQSSGGPSSAASIAPSEQALLRQLVREIHKQLWPDGFKGRAKERDKAIQEKFEQLNKKPPAVRTIQRALKGE
ncbi:MULTISPECIES: hypothetical protein [Bradyrhizobium]|uniref:hypothetical protein n=1 Tax=Bradyrhizobium elkanii TaxID=29448 RepID=UPI00042680CB|nr:hypothetical protein [Bradyrhizobium elkanii]